ncbi:DUF3667 domain-containing protein [Nitrospirillum sp. BR 11163]|uniref:DUF3667 domain-containing protein n=1 Tax=Nitrospirillum sp. BR 11163 TaxID=3104323 RepID=UPI002AFE843F|nr:DUF3667 domain-containing protein [Nitrospirillum sp. BR 11163]MEA1674166.1 DUF3667 domain-containing protein [Nitrospirillum sp. BR 11163]
MSGEMDAAGGLAEASLVARAIEGERHHTAVSHEDGHHRCANCGAHLAGAYCHACGQPGHVHRSMLHIMEEFFHGILHFDSKVWRTFPMLAFRPGDLTRRYVHGHRVRYVSPLALFLFSVFLMFFSLSFIDTPGKEIGGNALKNLDHKSLSDGRVELESAVNDAKAELQDAENDLADAKQDGGNVDKAAARRDKRQQELKVAEAMLKAFDAAAAAGLKATAKITPDARAAAAPAGKAAQPAEGGSPPAVVPEAAEPQKPTKEEHRQQQMAKLFGATDEEPATGDEPSWARAAKRLANSKGMFDVDLGMPKLEEHIRHALRNPELTLYKMKELASKLSFLLVPLSVPFIWLMFLFRRGIYLYDHVVFALHSLSFMAVLTAMAALGSRAGLGAAAIGSLMCFAPPIHMYAHLKGAYRLGTFGALWRTMVLLWVALLALTFYLLFIVSMGLVE